MTDSKTTLGQNIAGARKKLGRTQEECARKLGVSAMTWPRWEQGKTSPQIDTLVRVAELLKTTVARLTRDV